jgi:serine protease Do
MCWRSRRNIFNAGIGFALVGSLFLGCAPAAKADSTSVPTPVMSTPVTSTSLTANIPSLPSPQPGPAGRDLATPSPLVLLPASGAGVIADVAAKARLGVVQITTAQVALNRLNQETLVPQGVGSGVIIDEQGHILTNNHVVADAQSLQVSLPDGRTFPATLVGQDARSDLAVIRIQGTDLPVMPLGDSGKLVVGQWVIAIGDALALPGGPTVTAGVVGALGRTIQEPGSDGTSGGPFLFDLIQTDAAINPGNSGGPLVNLQGEVVGISTLGSGQTSSGVQPQGIGFAIAINTAKPIADALIQSGHVPYPYLGVQLYPNSPSLAVHFQLPARPGMIVVQVEPQGPAEKAGIRLDDLIVAADGKALTDESEFYRVLQTHRPGDQLPLTVARGDQELTLTISLGTAPAQ